MKNATRLYERGIREFLSMTGCESIHIEQGTIVALRPGKDGRKYQVSIDLYEDDQATEKPTRRFRARAARRHGLPVSANHGTSVQAALEALPWQTLDRHAIIPPPPVIAGVL